MIYFLLVVGAYVVRTSSLNDKHSCQLFRMGLRDIIKCDSTSIFIGYCKRHLFLVDRARNNP